MSRGRVALVRSAAYMEAHDRLSVLHELRVIDDTRAMVKSAEREARGQVVEA